MIVIATHNGKEFLRGSLEAIAEFGAGGRKVLVLDTGSTCVESIAQQSELAKRSWPFELEIRRTPYQAYDSGAYIHAYRNWPCESYLFMQDSVRPKSVEWLEAFERRATYGVGCVPWLIFPMQWDAQEEIDFVMEKTGLNDWPPHGIFGPIFYATREALDGLEKKGLLDVLPSSKIEQMAMERYWPTAFTLSGFAVRPVETQFEETMLRGDCYAHMTKQFVLRN